MEKVFRIRLKTATGKMSEEEMKATTGGYGSGGYGSGGYGSGGGQYSLKCDNTTHTCDVPRCPTSREEAEEMCRNCNSSIGEWISCAGASGS